MVASDNRQDINAVLTTTLMSNSMKKKQLQQNDQEQQQQQQRPSPKTTIFANGISTRFRYNKVLVQQIWLLSMLFSMASFSFFQSRLSTSIIMAMDAETNRQQEALPRQQQLQPRHEEESDYDYPDYDPYTASPTEFLSFTLEERAHILKYTKIPYYVYDDESLTLDNNKEIQNFIDVCQIAITKCFKYLPECYDALSEQSLLQELKNHPWNINNNDNNNGDDDHVNSVIDDSMRASTSSLTTVTQQRKLEDERSESMIHIIPTPMISLMYVRKYKTKLLPAGRCLTHRWKKEHELPTTGDPLDLLFESLTTQRRFISQDHGRYHVMLSIHFDLFASHRTFRIPGIENWYPKLDNITVAHHYDAIECQHVVKQQQKHLQQGQQYTDTVVAPISNTHEYLPTFTNRTPVVKYGFVLGLGAGDIAVPKLKKPRLHKYLKYDNEPEYNYIFYRTRRDPSNYNSTIYRLAPIKQIDSTKYPIFNDTYSSIGYDLPFRRWVKEMKQSKFCLAIRGDTPHTHALIRSIRAGCIPVVISDYYPYFASSFASIIKMNEYCIFISEKEFIENPAKALLSLREIPIDIIKQKIEGLKFVQRILFPDHPHTLFVPAFLQQTMHANKRIWWNTNSNSSGVGGYGSNGGDNTTSSNGIFSGGYYDTPL